MIIRCVAQKWQARLIMCRAPHTIQIRLKTDPLHSLQPCDAASFNVVGPCTPSVSFNWNPGIDFDRLRVVRGGRGIEELAGKAEDRKPMHVVWCLKAMMRSQHLPILVQKVNYFSVILQVFVHWSDVIHYLHLAILVFRLNWLCLAIICRQQGDLVMTIHPASSLILGAAFRPLLIMCWHNTLGASGHRKSCGVFLSNSVACRLKSRSVMVCLTVLTTLLIWICTITRGFHFENVCYMRSCQAALIAVVLTFVFALSHNTC